MTELALPPPLPPNPTDAEIVDFLQRLHVWLRTREPQADGAIGDKFVPYSALSDLGALGGNALVIGGGGGGGGGTPDTTPPTPIPLSGFTVVGGITQFIVEFQAPTYTEGGGNAYTEIYAANWDGVSPLPTFANAVMVYAATGSQNVVAIPAQPGQTTHFWLGAVTRAGVRQVDGAGPTGGINGVSATTGVDVSDLLDVLTNQITESQLYADLNTRIDLIDGNMAGSVNERIQGETAARIAALIAEADARALADAALTAAQGTLATAAQELTGSVLSEADARALADSALSAATGLLDQIAQNIAASLAVEAELREAADAALSAAQELLQQVAGSLAASILAEADARTLAGDIIGAALAALNASAGEVSAAVTTEREVRIEGDSALAAQVTAVVATSSGAVAGVVVEQTARADADDALAAQITTVAAASGENAAAVRVEQEARADADGAMAAQTTTLAAQAGDSAAALVVEQRTRADGDSAGAAQVTTLAAAAAENTAGLIVEQEVRADADGASVAQITSLAAAVGENAAAVLVEQDARADADGAMSAQTVTLVAASGANAAGIVVEQAARADADAAMASQVATLAAQAGDAVAAIVEEQTVRVSQDTVLAGQITTVGARLDIGGDVYSSIVAVDTKAQTALDNGTTNASQITLLESEVTKRNKVFRQAIIPASDATYTLQPNDLWFDAGSENCVRWSEAIDNAVWVKTRIVTPVGINAATAPDGTTTADKIVENTETGPHHISAVLQGTIPDDAIVTVYAYVKAAERTRCDIQIHRKDTTYAQVKVNLTTGAIVSTTGGYTSRSMPAGNGWWLVSLTGSVLTGAGAVRLHVFLDNGSATNYTGDGTSGIFVWGGYGAVLGGPGRYIRTEASTVSTIGNNQPLTWDGTQWVLTEDPRIPSTRALLLNDYSTTASMNSAISSAVTTLAAQVRGGYTGDDLSGLTEGLIYQERFARAKEDSALAQQISLLSAGTDNQFDYSDIWYWDSGLNGWTGPVSGTTTTNNGGWLKMVASSGSVAGAYVLSPDNLNDSAGVDGTKYTQVRARIRKYGSPTWEGKCYFTTVADNTWTEGKSASVSEPAYDVNGIGLLTWNMPGTWLGQAIRCVRIDLSDPTTTADYFEIDWVAIGRPSPGASSAELASIQTAMVDGFAVQASDITTLYTKIDSPTTGNNPTYALLIGSYSTTVDMNSAIAASELNLSSSIGANTAAIQSEATTRATNDAALSANILTLASATGDNAAGLIVEQQTRTDGDAALSAQTIFLAASAGTTAAAVVVEQEVRATQDAAVSSQVTVLAAAAGNTAAGIVTEQNVRADSDAALGVQVQTLVARIEDSAAAIIAEQEVRAAADDVLAAQTLTLAAAAGTNAAALVVEQETRVTADVASAAQVTTLAAATGAAIAALQVEQDTRTTEDSALAAQSSVLAVGLGATTAGLFSEQEARVDATGAVASSVTGLAAATSTTSAGLMTEQVARADADDATASRVDSLAAAVGTNAAAIVSEQAVRVAEDSALASQVMTLSASVGDNSAAIVTTNQVVADLDDATATQITTLQSRIEGAGENLLSNPSFEIYTGTNGLADGWSAYGLGTYGTPVREVVSGAAVHGTRYQKITATSSGGTTNDRVGIQTQLLTLPQGSGGQEFSLSGYIAGTSGMRGVLFVGWFDASNVARRYDGSTILLTGTDNFLRVSWTGNAHADAVKARVFVWCDSYAGAMDLRVDAVQLQRGGLTGFSAGDNTAAIQQEMTTRASETGDLFAKYTVKVDVNGYVSGFGLASTANNATPYSEFAIVADKFSIAPVATSHSAADGSPFFHLTAPTSINGVSVPAGTYMKAAYIHDATITNAKIAALAVDNAKIASLSAAKLTAGSIGVGAYIQSTSYAPGSAGWRIHGDGTAEFSGVIVRGTLLGGSATAYGTGLGMFSGWTSGTSDANYRWRVGSPSAARIQWTGSAIEVYNASNQLTFASGGAVWDYITGAGKPENNATVGADWQSNVVNRDTFSDTFTDLTAFQANWTNHSGAGELSLSTSFAALAGGLMLKAGNNSGDDQVWLIHNKNIPFEQGALYRIRVRARRDAGAGLAYFGLAGIAENGTTFVDFEGAPNVSGQYYVAASSLNLTTAMTEYVGYIKGSAATGTTTASPNPASPGKVHTNVRFIRPLMILNFPSAAGISFVDYFIIEKVAGAMGTLDQITSSNISTYIESAAIGSAYINDLHGEKITAGTIVTSKLQVGAATQSVIGVATATNLSIASYQIGSTSNLDFASFTRAITARATALTLEGQIAFTVRNTGWTGGNYSIYVLLSLGSSGEMVQYSSLLPAYLEPSMSGTTFLVPFSVARMTTNETMFPTGSARTMRVKVDDFKVYNPISGAVLAALNTATVSLNYTVTEFKV